MKINRTVGRILAVVGGVAAISLTAWAKAPVKKATPAAAEKYNWLGADIALKSRVTAVPSPVGDRNGTPLQQYVENELRAKSIRCKTGGRTNQITVSTGNSSAYTGVLFLMGDVYDHLTGAAREGFAAFANSPNWTASTVVAGKIHSANVDDVRKAHIFKLTNGSYDVTKPGLPFKEDVVYVAMVPGENAVSLFACDPEAIPASEVPAPVVPAKTEPVKTEPAKSVKPAASKKAVK